MVDRLIDRQALSTPQYIAAFRAIDRAYFLPNDLGARSYADFPLPIGFGQTISQPETVAFMIELLKPGPGQKILDVGAGSGYQTALLSWIVSHNLSGEELSKEKQGKVIGLEIIPELAKLSAKHIEKYKFFSRRIAEIHCLNGAKSYLPEAPFDRIIAAASGENIPTAWQEQLKTGGRLVSPLFESIVLHEKTGTGVFTVKNYEGFIFVPFVSDKNQEL